jgi:hypothetical protein
MKDLLDRFLAWHRHPASSAEAIFAEDFEYQGCAGLHVTEAWRLVTSQQPAWTHVDVISTVVEADQAALFVEIVDPVTQLRHRIAWLIRVRDRKITSLVEIDCILD